MDANVDDKWMTRQEVADRHGVPVKTLAQWASQGKGPGTPSSVNMFATS